jgi:hypothetical protein
MASAGGYTKIAISCSGGGFYETSNPSPRWWTNMYAQSNTISEVIANFLSKHGVNAVSESPLPHGVAAGGLGIMLTTGKFVLQFQKINNLVQQWREKHAYIRRRELLPNIIVRIEVLQENRESHYSNQDDLSSVQHLVALIKELSDFLRLEYPALRVEYLIVAPKGSRSCFSIYIPDNLVSNLSLMKVANGLSKEKAKKFCTVKLERRLKVLSKITFSDKTHRSNTLFNCHHINCEVPQWEFLDK